MGSQNKTQKKYNLSFIAANLSLSSSIIVAEVYWETRNWKDVRERVFAENLIQARTQSSLKRSYSEISTRLQALTDEQIDLLVHGSVQEQKQLLWLALCKKHQYVREFAIEVVREKFLSMDFKLTELDYIAFYNRKADWHVELEEIAESTQYKVKQILFRILVQVGILTEEHIIRQIILTARVKDVIKSDHPSYFQIFPVLYDETNQEGEEN